MDGGDGMRFGISIPNFRGPASLETFQRVARRAEKTGFDDVWLGDHVVLPKHTRSAHPYSSPDRVWIGDIPVYDAFPLMGYLAAITDRVDIALGTLVVPYRNPVVQAKMLSTLSVLSGSRIILGVGVGWIPEEFEALDVPFERRGALTDEYLDLMKTLWADAEASYEGEFYRYPAGMWFEPRPATPIPIWVRGNTPVALRRAARIGDGWYGVRLSADQVAAVRAELGAMLSDRGRDPDGFTYSLRVTVEVDGPAHSAADVVGPAEQVAEAIGEYAAAGLNHFQMATDPRLTTDELINQIDLFTDDVRPLLNGR